MIQRTFPVLAGDRKYRVMAMLCMTLTLLLIAGLCAACTKTKAVSDEMDPITGFAWELINRDIANYESNPEVDIIDSKITRLEKVETFDKLADRPIYVYALEYRLLPEDLSKVIMAGGMDADEEGWLKETCSMGSPLLVISDNEGGPEFIGTLWTGGVIEDGGMEASIKAMLERKE